MNQNGKLARDDNDTPVMGGTSSSDNATIINSAFDPVTRRLLTDSAGGGSGTVTEITQSTGILLTPNPITTTGTVGLATNIAPIATLGTALQSIRVNAGATALEYYTPTSGTVTSVSGTTNRITSTGGATPVIDISASYVGQTSITTLGTVTTGTLSTGAIIGGVTMTLGSDATGDIYYRNAGGILTRLAIGSSNNVLTVSGGLPSWAAPAAAALTVGTTTIASGTTTRILYDNAGVLGEYTLTGSGTVVAMATAPTFVTSITTPSVLATANDSGALGASGTAFSDLFLASGAVINFAAGNVTLTHSSGILTQNAGELRITSANVGTNADSVPTLSSTSTLTNKTLTSPSIGGTALLQEGAGIGLDPSLSADGTWSGITMTATAGYTQAFGDLVYLSVTDSRWELADADAATTAGPVALAMVVVAGTDGNSCTLLLQGVIRADAKFPTMTVGATQYVGETAGAIQGTIPTGADNVIRTVGYALTADALYFNPSTDWQVAVA